MVERSASCDVVVIGGGPGGSACATLLAEAGWSVVLLERASFPREHVGESLLPASMPVLERLGAMEAVAAAGFVTKRGATLIWGKDRAPWSWYFADDPQQRPTSFQVLRSEFDAILLENARQHGVDVRERHQVTGVEFGSGGGGRSATRYLHGGEAGTMEARFVVDASGQAAVLGRQLGLREWDAQFRNLAVYGYYRGGRHLDAPDDGNIFIESYAGGWLWKIPLHTGVSSVGAVVDQEAGLSGLRELGATRFLQAQVASSGETRALLADAELEGEAKVERDWSYRSRSFAGEGWALAGDAACFVDPLFSSGVHLALGSGAMAAEYVTAALKRPSRRAEAARKYQEAYERQYRYFHLTAQLFYGTNRSTDSYFWEARRILGDQSATPREAFVRVVSGQPPHGYERAVIEHGELPPAIASEVARRDQVAERRRRETEALVQGAGGLLGAVLSLPARVRVEGGPSAGGFRLRLEGAGEFTEGAPITASLAACLSQLDGRTPLSAVASRVARAHGLGDGEQLARLAARDLPPLIEAGLVDAVPGSVPAVKSVGRNDPCPCGSGKKYKRCHGGSGRV